ncbi:glycosyltransferase [Actinoallomurus acanthiterrae]
MLPLLVELSRRGHEVRVASAESFATEITSAGLRPVTAGLDFRVGDEEGLVPALAEARKRGDRTFPYTRRVLVETLGRAALPDLLAFASAWRPHIVLRDTVEFAGLAVAEALGIPHATGRENRFLPPSVWASELGTSLRDLGRLAGAPDLGVPALYRYLGVAPVPPRFATASADLPDAREFGRHVHATMRFVRPVPFGERAGRTPVPPSAGAPVLIATFGTVFAEQPSLLDALLGAAARSTWQVVITHDPPAGLGRIPANVRFVGYTPLGRLLPLGTAVLTLGGLGTVLAALAHGLPLVVAPVNADQPTNAARCEALGTGIRVDAASVTAAELGAAIEQVLTDPSFAGNAGRLRTELDRLPGPDAAAALVETVARTGVPVESGAMPA